MTLSVLDKDKKLTAYYDNLKENYTLKINLPTYFFDQKSITNS